MLRRSFLEFIGFAPIAAQVVAAAKHSDFQATMQALIAKFGEPLSHSIIASTKKFKGGSSVLTELVYHKKGLTIRIREQDGQAKLIFCGDATRNSLHVCPLKANWTTEEVISLIPISG